MSCWRLPTNDSDDQVFRLPYCAACCHNGQAAIHLLPIRKNLESVDRSCEQREHRKGNRGRCGKCAESAGRVNTAISSTALRVSLDTSVYSSHVVSFGPTAIHAAADARFPRTFKSSTSCEN